MALLFAAESPQEKGDGKRGWERGNGAGKEERLRAWGKGAQGRARACGNTPQGPVSRAPGHAPLRTAVSFHSPMPKICDP